MQHDLALTRDIEPPARVAASDGLRVHVADWRTTRAENEIRFARLAEHASQPNPFFEPWHLFPSLEALDPAGKVVLWWLEDADGEALGMLPLQRESAYYGRPLPHWRNWMHANCFLGAPLVRGGAERQFWAALLGWLDGAAATPMFMHLAGLPLDTPLTNALDAVTADAHRAARCVHIENRAMLAGSQDPQKYLESVLSTKRRKELRRQRRRLEELGAVTNRCQRDDSDLDNWISDFLTIEAAGWKGEQGTAIGNDAAKTAVFEAALRGAAQHGRLERRTVLLDDAPIAMLATFRTPPGAFSYKTTFVEEFARFSPGVLLQIDNLDSLADPDIDWVDSCASEDHPMIDKMWRDRRAVGRYSIGIGGKLRQALFGAILKAEGGAQ